MKVVAVPEVSHLEIAILVPFRIVDDAGQPPTSMQQLSRQLQADQPKIWSPIPPPVELPDRARAHQAYAYFHPFVRRFLFDPQRVICLQRQDLLALEVQPGGYKPPAARRFSVTACRLWLFELTEIGMLQLSLMGPQQGETWPLKDVQLQLDQVRRLYPPYFGNVQSGAPDKAYAGHCPVSVKVFTSEGGKDEPAHTGKFGNIEHYLKEGERWAQIGRDNEARASFTWAEHWRAILSPFNTLPDPDRTPSAVRGRGKRWHAVQLGDDRAALMSFIGFKNEEAFRQVAAGDWVRLCFADQPGSDRFPYQQAFLRGNAIRPGFFARHCYDRYNYPRQESGDSPSRIMNCGYAFTWAGCATDQYFFMDELNGAQATFANLYIPMGVIAHFQRAALLDTSFRISCLVKPQLAAPISPQDTRRAYASFIAFTQWYWFDEISPQEQGQQLFDMWRRELRLVELFNETRQELRDLVEAQNAEQQLDQSEATIQLTRVATVFATLSVFIALLSFGAGWLGMNVFVEVQAVGLTRDGARVAAFLLAGLGGTVVAAALYALWRWRLPVIAAFKRSG